MSEMHGMEEARLAYIAAVATAKERQDDGSVAAAAKARLHLQSFAFRNWMLTVAVSKIPWMGRGHLLLGRVYHIVGGDMSPFLSSLCFIFCLIIYLFMTQYGPIYVCTGICIYISFCNAWCQSGFSLLMGSPPFAFGSVQFESSKSIPYNKRIFGNLISEIQDQYRTLVICSWFHAISLVEPCRVLLVCYLLKLSHGGSRIPHERLTVHGVSISRNCPWHIIINWKVT